MYNVQCTMDNGRCTIYDVRYTMYNGQWTMDNVRNTMWMYDVADAGAGQCGSQI